VSLFTQKHYEYLGRELAAELKFAEARDKRVVAIALSRVFSRDNQRFKPEVFESDVIDEANREKQR
jgi:hypothetical protein